MAAANQTQQQIAASDAVLMEKVAYPAFFQKLAALGYDPGSEDGARRLVELSDRIAPAVQAFVANGLQAQAEAKSAAVSTALDAALEVAGVPTGRAAVMAADPADAGDYLNDPAVKAAAEHLAAERLKAAALPDVLKKEEEEEEKDEHGNPKPKMSNMAGGKCD